MQSHRTLHAPKRIIVHNNRVDTISLKNFNRKVELCRGDDGCAGECYKKQEQEAHVKSLYMVDKSCDTIVTNIGNNPYLSTSSSPQTPAFSGVFSPSAKPISNQVLLKFHPILIKYTLNMYLDKISWVLLEKIDYFVFYIFVL